ncbi:MAG: class I SAM-dependent methyltransferase [Bdellovibrionales bacterium]
MTPTSLDISEVAVQKMTQAGMRASGGTITTSPFQENEFDAVVLSEVIEHLNDEEIANLFGNQTNSQAQWGIHRDRAFRRDIRAK